MFSYLKRRTRSAGVGANLIASPHRQHNRFSFLLGRVLAAEKLMQRQWKKKVLCFSGEFRWGKNDFD
jgi:hypothetical protein